MHYVSCLNVSLLEVGVSWLNLIVEFLYEWSYNFLFKPFILFQVTVILELLLEELLLVLLCCLQPLQLHLLIGEEGNLRIISLMFLVSWITENKTYMLINAVYDSYNWFTEIFSVLLTAEEDPEVHLGQLKRFSLRELQVATDNFSNKHILGRGGFGKVYKGRLADGSLVAVKRLKEERTQGGELQFQTEVEMISMAVHRNLLRLRGFCMTPTERLLVYPYMANGSVASCLRGIPINAVFGLLFFVIYLSFSYIKLFSCILS